MKRAALAVLAVAIAAPAPARAETPRVPLRLGEGLFRTRLAMRRAPSPSPSPTPTPNPNPNPNPTPNPNPIPNPNPNPNPIPNPNPNPIPNPSPIPIPSPNPTLIPTPIASRPARPRSRPAPEPPTIVVPSAHAQVSLGLAVDGAGLGGPTGAGFLYNDGVHNYDPARAYMFGEAFLGTRGLVVPGISAYLASQFQLAPSTDLAQVPILRAWDRVDPIQIRTAWTEADGIFDRGLLRTLRVRGGRQYVYGPAVAHLDGLSASWKTSRFRAGAYIGSRVADWYPRVTNPDATDAEASPPRGLVTGGELALVLRRGRAPLAVRVRALQYRGATHSDFTIDWTARPDLVLAITSRLADREATRQHVTARYRWSQETRIVVDADVRHRADWLWDYDVRTPDDLTAPRRYLDLGPSLPRLTMKVRAGTVLLDNVDLLVFGGAALDSSSPEEAATSSTAAGYVEGGGAFEVRMRRTLSVAVSGLTRVYSRTDLPVPVRDDEDAVGRLDWRADNVGERSLLEGGVTAKVTGGARRFSVSGEIYARRTRYARYYVNDVSGTLPEVDLGDSEAHGGGRFLLEAWINPAMRVRAEYDLSNRLSLAQETDGLKALRIIAEGTY